MTNRGKILDFEIDEANDALVLAHEYEAVSIVGLKSGAPRELYLGFGASVRCLGLSHSKNMVFAGGGDSAVFALSLPELKRISRRNGHKNWVYDLVIDPRQDVVYSTGPDTLILIWNQLSATPIDTLKGHKSWIWKLKFGPDPNHLFSSAGETELVRWNLEKGKIDVRFHGHLAAIFDIDVHPEGQMLASCSWDGTVRIWNVQTGNEIQLLTPRQLMQSVCWSADGKFLILGDYAGNLYVYQVQGWKKIHQFQAHSGAIRKISFLRGSGNTLEVLTAGDDSRLKFWDFSAWLP